MEPSGDAFVIQDDMPYANTKPILEINDKDLNHDNTKDTVGLYLSENLDVILRSNDDDISVFNISHEGQVFGNTPSDRYRCNLYIEGNKILVGVTYSFTNKYGSTSWLYAYSYESGKIERIWSSEEIFQKKVLIENYNEAKNIIEVKVGTEIKEIHLGDAEEEEFIIFTDYLGNTSSKEMEMELIITPDYEYKDYNGDGLKEIITRTIVAFGASSLCKSYYSVYEFSGEGVRLVDGFFQ